MLPRTPVFLGRQVFQASRCAVHAMQHARLNHELPRGRRKCAPRTVCVRRAVRHDSAESRGGCLFCEVERLQMLEASARAERRHLRRPRLVVDRDVFLGPSRVESEPIADRFDLKFLRLFAMTVEPRDHEAMLVAPSARPVRRACMPRSGCTPSLPDRARTLRFLECNREMRKPTGCSTIPSTRGIRRRERRTPRTRARSASGRLRECVAQFPSRKDERRPRRRGTPGASPADQMRAGRLRWTE